MDDVDAEVIHVLVGSDPQLHRLYLESGLFRQGVDQFVPLVTTWMRAWADTVYEQQKWDEAMTESIAAVRALHPPIEWPTE